MLQIFTFSHSSVGVALADLEVDRWIPQVPLPGWPAYGVDSSRVSAQLFACTSPLMTGSVYIGLMFYCLNSAQSPIFLTGAVMEVSSSVVMQFELPSTLKLTCSYQLSI